LGIKKQREKKKYKKKRETEKKVLARRAKTQADNRAKKRAERAMHRTRQKIRPFVKDPEARKKMEEQRVEDIQKQLEKNLAILEALEEEYEKEVAEKEKLNAELEKEGLTTLKEKLDALEQKAKEEIKERGLEAYIGDEDEGVSEGDA
jgi:hypothetical protein